ncbi:DinB family protein [Herbiconiux sp. CPCC 203407]|uniref:DinB family protein n=1 Tax=Herbiconiux oxytropis TaxID=2970915 RepID=A0AA41XBX8_9MICO|nr:DinB family protein [Herbiconiux oxytropis]MCS5722704.1 DinB family protein [Herbiconiux oxytropis]MCS5725401.1 DinB family protein [Herbiconiux oxytropis]
MIDSTELLDDAFTRIRETVRRATGGLTPEQLTARIDPEANTIAWLVWHLIRVQDDHIAEVAGTEQVWTSGGWSERFGLPFETDATGYGHSPAEVAQVAGPGVTSESLVDYHEAVYAATSAYLRSLPDDELSRVVDESWDPPVTLAVRLVSVISDDLQHAGQASFVRGVIERRG